MAYLEFSAGELHSVAKRQQVIEIPRRGLDERERGAVMLARTDRKDSLRSTGRLHRLSVICFGLSRRPNKLADPRLESLRRYAVAVAHDTQESAAREREQLVALGFSDQQILMVAATAVRFRVKPVQGLWSVAALSILIGSAFWGINQYLDDWLIALVLAMVIAVPIMAMTGPRAAA